MDDKFAELENELAQLSPAPVRPELMARVNAAMQVEPTALRPDSRRYTSATSWTSWKWANWSVAAVLGALMFTVSQLAPPPTDLAEGTALAATDAVMTPELRPVRAGRTLIGSRVDGVVELADGSSVERVRDFYLDTIEWRDEDGRSQLRWEIPREAVRFVGLTSY